MSQIRFRALSGQLEGPLCFLLQIDDAQILLDCGWTDAFDPANLEALAGVAKQVDAVLLTHGDLDHLGAFTYAVTKLGVSCPAYATYPVHDMGQMCMYDAFHSKRNEEDFDVFNLADIDAAFATVQPLRYSQPQSLSGRCKGITITAYSAGHTLGGTIWTIKKDTDDIVYAVDYNHIKDRHLNGTVLLSIQKPSILITDCYNALVTQDRRAQRDNALKDAIFTTLQDRGSVLIPIESATRSLEFTYLLEGFWQSISELRNYTLIFLSNHSQSTINVAKRMLEWMGDQISSLIASDRKAPFDFQHVKMVHNLKDLEKYDRPKVVIASMASMDVGFSHQLFVEWASKKKNLVIIPDRGGPNTLARKLYDEWKGAEVKGPRPNLHFDLNLMEKRKVPLEGEELTEYLAREALRKEQEAALEAQRVRLKMEEEGSEMSEDDEMQDGGKVTLNLDIYVKDTTRSASFFKQAQSFHVFPMHESRARVDDYGEFVDPMAFITAEQQIEEKSEELPALPEFSQKNKIEDTVPSKYIVVAMKVEVRCKVIFIDLEGRSDGRFVKNMLEEVAPRKLILVHGSSESSEYLSNYCRDHATITKEILCPKDNEWADISAATNSYQIKLTDSLVSSLTFAKINEYELAYVSGIVRINMEVDQTATGGKNTSNIPVLDLIPYEVRKLHTPVIVGDLKMSEFRRVLLDHGFEAEFVSGVLIVNNTMMVRKSQQGRLLLEGPFGSEYFRLRRLMYETHAVL